MKNRDDWTFELKRQNNGKYETWEQHLFDTDAREEEALCGVDTSADDRIGVDYYVDSRKNGLPVGTVCEGCKALAVPYAVNLIRDLEADCRVDDAGEYRQLADTLLRETDPLIHVCCPSCVQQPAVRPLTGAAPPQTR